MSQDAMADDALEQFERLYRLLLGRTASYQTVDDRELVSRTLKLANDFADVEPADLISPLGLISLGHDAKMRAFFNKMPASVLRSSWDDMEPARKQFRERLDLLFADRKKARADLSAAISSTLDQIIPIPRLRWAGNALVTEMLYATRRTEARCNFALMLLLDESREIWRNLRLCGLPGCNRYFLTTGSGRPRVYCTSEHQDIATKLTGAERTERWRERQKAKARKPK